MAGGVGANQLTMGTEVIRVGVGHEREIFASAGIQPKIQFGEESRPVSGFHDDMRTALGHYLRASGRKDGEKVDIPSTIQTFSA
jgi:hypothetical protein